MNRKNAAAYLLALAGSTGLWYASRVENAPTRPAESPHPDTNIVFQNPPASSPVAAEFGRRRPPSHGSVSKTADGLAHSDLSLPMTFEPNVGQADPRIQFIGRGRGMAALLLADRIVLQEGNGNLAIQFQTAGTDLAGKNRPRRPLLNGLAWRGEQPVRGTTNYLLGNDHGKWRTNIPHFSSVRASQPRSGIGIAAYGNERGLEYDLQLNPGTDASRVHLALTGATDLHIDTFGDLVMRLGNDEIRMKRPRVYQTATRRHSIKRKRKHTHTRKSQPNHSTRRRSKRRRTPTTRKKRVSAAYVIEPDGSIGFRLGRYDPREPLIIDPSLSVTYATFLGGAGTETVGGIALDSAGKIYVGGTTTSASTFPEVGSRIGPVDGPSEFFIAKIDPTVSGPNSLVYLTFLGGSGQQTGGLIAVNTSGGVAITGATTSIDFPVTDTSQPTNGLTSGYGNDSVVSEIDPAGTGFVFSTIFGGSGVESQGSAGGVALDPSGDVYIASVTATTPVDSSSPDLPVTVNAFQTTWDGGAGDGFVAIFEPPAQSGGAATLKYCSYLGTNAPGSPAVGGIAVDQTGNAYIVGSVGNSPVGFPAKNAFQSAYGGGASDAFLMKISPLGQGAQDLVYATLLGGSGTDQALAVAVDSSTTPDAYVTGLTQSSNFPTNAPTAPYQSSLHPSTQSNQSNAFLTVVAQDPVSGQTWLTYSTYLGGSAADAGQSVAVTAPNSVYVAGSATSYDFPWHDNLQPFNGAGVAFSAKLDPTSAGAASLIYATPLGGTSPSGGSASAMANAVASDGAGHVYIAGTTTSGDFPTAVTTQSSVNGFQQTCSSCTPLNPSTDAFAAEMAESSTPAPSVAFSLPSWTFNPASGGAPQALAILNEGEAGLTISSISLTGQNATDFSLTGQGSCIGPTISPGPAAQCSFEITFTPSQVGPETAAISVTDNAPGSPQVFQLFGTGGNGPLAQVTPAALSFGSQPQNTSSPIQVVTLTNIGNQLLTLANFDLGGADVAQFQLVPGGTNGAAACEREAQLPASGVCVLQISFDPTAEGSFSAEIDFFDNSGNAANTEQVVPLTGSGVAPAPTANVAPAALTFGTEPVGSSSGSQSVTLTNSGSAALDVTGIALTGINAADFTIPSSGTTCPVTGGTVAIDVSCTVSVQFAPQSAGSKNASVTFTDNAPGSPQQVSLSATATAPPTPLTASPTSLTFAAQSMSTTSSAQIITISNTTGAAAGPGSVSVSDTEFGLANSCPPSIAAGASCQLSLSFTPNPATLAGPRSATLTISGATPSTIALSGIATQSGISLPPSVNFASQLAGTAGTAVPITVTNTSSGPYAGALSVVSAQTSGTNAADFVISSDGCAAASTQPGNTCTISMQFKPQQASTCGANGGARSATLSLSDNAPASPQSVSLAGTAMDFCLGTAPGQGISQPIPAGQSETFNLEVQSSAGFSGSAVVTCSNAPPLGTCTVSTSPATSPTAVQINSTTPGQFQLVVTSTAPSSLTGAAQSRRLLPGALSSNARWNIEKAILLSICALWIICAVVPRPVHARFRSTNALLLVIVLAAFCCLSSCGGGGDPGTSNPGTPSGTYNVTVTAAVTVGESTVTRTMTVPVTIE